MDNEKTRIFITGGHFSPAMAVIEVLKTQGNWDIFYVGRKHSMEDDQAIALEYLELAAREDIRYLVINAGRLQRKFFVQTLQSIKALVKVGLGLVQSVFWLIRYRPRVILSFGGYVALPVVFVGWLMHIPIVTHEQTVVSGLSNRLIAFFASEVLVSWPESLPRFSRGKKVILSGDPIRKALLDAIKTAPVGSKSPVSLPVIYITGGNQGSHVLNQAVGEILPQLLDKHIVIHQTGDSQIYADFETLTENRNKLSPELQTRYKLYKFLEENEVAETLNQASLVISRSGANTVTELMAKGLPAIFIPIPWSDSGEQEQNAQMMASRGAATVIHQNDLTGRVLLQTISDMETSLSKFQEAAKQCQQFVRLDAAETIVHELSEIMSASTK